MPMGYRFLCPVQHFVSELCPPNCHATEQGRTSWEQSRREGAMGVAMGSLKKEHREEKLPGKPRRHHTDLMLARDAAEE